MRVTLGIHAYMICKCFKYCNVGIWWSVKYTDKDVELRMVKNNASHFNVFVLGKGGIVQAFFLLLVPHPHFLKPGHSDRFRGSSVSLPSLEFRHLATFLLQP